MKRRKGDPQREIYAINKQGDWVPRLGSLLCAYIKWRERGRMNWDIKYHIITFHWLCKRPETEMLGRHRLASFPSHRIWAMPMACRFHIFVLQLRMGAGERITTSYLPFWALYSCFFCSLFHVFLGYPMLPPQPSMDGPVHRLATAFLTYVNVCQNYTDI